MKAGPHGNEKWKPILRRKMEEERSPAGAIWWGYGGTMLDPRRLIPFCKKQRVEVAMFETTSNPGTSGAVVASRYSTDQVRWHPMPRGVSVRGSTRALVLREFRVVRETIDLSQYEIAVGPSARTTADDFFFKESGPKRTDKACLRRRERDAPPRIVRVTVQPCSSSPSPSTFSSCLIARRETAGFAWEESSAGEDGALLLVLLLCQEVDGWGAVSDSGWGAPKSCQMRRARWRLRQRIASRWVLPSDCLRSMKSIRLGVTAAVRLSATPPLGEYRAVRVTSFQLALLAPTTAV